MIRARSPPGAAEPPSPAVAPAPSDRLSGIDTDMDPKPASDEVAVDVEDVGPCKKKLKVRVPAEAVASEFDKNYREISGNVVLPGFRRGKVPRTVIEKRYGKEITREVKQKLIERSFEEAITRHQMQPMSRPELDIDAVTAEPGKSLEYEVTLEVRPTFEIRRYKGFKAVKPPVVVGERDVDEALVSLARSRATLVPVEGGKAREGDVAIVDIAVRRGEDQLGGKENAAIQLTEDRLLGWKAPGLKEALLGKGEGDVVEVEFAFPKTERSEGNATATLLVKDVKAIQVPEPNDAWAKELDFDSVKELRDNLRSQIAGRREQDAERAVEDAILDQILNDTPFDVPESLARSQTEQSAARLRVQLQMDGKSEDEINRIVVDFRDKGLEDMVRALKKGFVLDKIATLEKIFVTEDEVNEHLEAMARQSGKWPHEMREELEAQGLLNEVRSEIRERKARATLRTLSEITSAPPLSR